MKSYQPFENFQHFVHFEQPPHNLKKTHKSRDKKILALDSRLKSHLEVRKRDLK